MYLTLNRSARALPRHVALNGFAPSFDALLDDFFRAPATRDVATSVAPRFDVIEKGDVFEVRLEIPGVNKEDIDVQIDGAVVSIKAESKSEDKLADGERVLHSSRVTRSWARSITLPVELADDRAEAAYENGVLTLTLPKKDVVQPKRIAIK